MDLSGTEQLAPERFSAAVLYEDRETRDRAIAVCRHLEAQVGDEIELSFCWWRFDFLRDPELAQEAANAAMVADMLVISAQPGRGLPPEFTEWVESWLARRGQRDSVLVALIGSEQDSMPDASIEYLRQIATRARIDYVSKPLLMPAAVPPNLTASRPNPATKTSFLGDLRTHVRPPSHWGINE